ncbi:hypothetical protein ACHMW6_00180 (plasmid) [Pseudoduganella sp. UC29_106]|uniref:hypothetical protein n=1 Tax=Pseudoduganella sp. UC29_106 TaxID=3374553 RepID=UPI0037567BAD
MVIGVGPIRKGKTFTKNTLATHTLKYGGLYRALDIDPGSEPIAGLFGEDGGIMRAAKDDQSGANLFFSARGQDDVSFKIHLIEVLKLMLEANDTESQRQIDDHEQKGLDEAIDATLALPKELQTMSALVAHMPPTLQTKFARWIRESPKNRGSGAGWFAHVFDNQNDAIGHLTKRVGVFNLQNVKDQLRLLRPIQADILYRITQAFRRSRHPSFAQNSGHR